MKMTTVMSRWTSHLFFSEKVIYPFSYLSVLNMLGDYLNISNLRAT